MLQLELLALVVVQLELSGVEEGAWESALPF